MSLDSVMFINLERRQDRYWFAMGGLRTLGFNVHDDSQVVRFVAHDGQAYSDVAAVHNAAVADRFHEFADFTADTRNYAAWYWTYRCALRHIIEIDKTVLLLIDDHLPKPGWSFLRLSYLVDYCEFREDHGPFRILQLAHSFYGHEQGFNQEPETSMLAKGLTGGFDVAAIISPAGAKLLLEMAKLEPLNAAPDSWFSRIYQRQANSEYTYGLWHTLDPVCEHAFIFGETDLPYEE